jgi:zinc protease
VDFEHERVATPSVGFYYTTPGMGALSQADAIALNLIGRLTGTEIIGRFHRALVTEQRLAVDVSAGHWYDLRGGILSFTATAAPGVAVADLEKALAQQIAALARDGATAGEADDARTAFLAGKAYDDDNHRSLASAYGQYLSRGLTVADVESLYDLVERVTAEDVNRVITRFMAKTEPVVAVMRPKSLAAK